MNEQSKTKKTLINSFTITPTFTMGTFARAADLGGLEIHHGFQQSLIVSLVPLRAGISRFADSVTPP